jgi:hypothetical protein
MPYNRKKNHPLACLLACRRAQLCADHSCAPERRELYPGRPSKNYGIYNPEAEETKAVLDRARLLLLRLLRLHLLLSFCDFSLSSWDCFGSSCLHQIKSSQVMSKLEFFVFVFFN